ncbi:MAG: type II toxin-antitoxin system PemK/MazF family toxin [Candidatus Xenobia bacterium]
MVGLKKWDVVVGRLDPTEGSEQAGTRPLLVISRDEVNRALSILTVLPITSQKPGRRVYLTEVALPVGAAGLPKPSIVMIHQVRTIARSRVASRLGSLDDPSLRNLVLEVVSRYFEI